VRLHCSDTLCASCTAPNDAYSRRSRQASQPTVGCGACIRRSHCGCRKACCCRFPCSSLASQATAPSSPAVRAHQAAVRGGRSPWVARALAVVKMRSPTVGRASLLLRRTMLVASCIYASVGSGGYVIFRDRTAGNILRNFSEVGLRSGSVAFAVRHMKLVFALSVAGAVPVTMLPLTELLISLLRQEPGAAVPPLLRLAVNASLLALTLLLALLLPNVELVFALAGSTGAVMQAYIFPCAAFVVAHQADASMRCDKEVTDSLAAETVSPLAADLWCRQEAEDAAAARAGNLAAAERVEEELFGVWLRGRPARIASWLLLAFGVGAMYICTNSVLRAVADEAAIVSLAQHIAALDEAAQTAPSNASRLPATAAGGLFHLAGAYINVTALNATAAALTGNASNWRAEAATPTLLTRAKELAAELEVQDRERGALPFSETAQIALA